MACTADSTSLISSNPGIFSGKSLFPSRQPSSQTLTLPISFSGLHAPLSSPVARPAYLTTRSFIARRNFVVKAQANDLPLVGNKAPDFETEAVFDQEFIKITAFSDRYEEFEKLNTEILGVSVDSALSHLAWVQTDRKSGGLGDLKYPLISDVTKSISKSYGVLIPDQRKRILILSSHAKKFRLYNRVIALRGLFIIDKEGVIQHSTINNLAIGRSVDETMRTLQALQYVQENPDDVCPAGWKPDPKLSKEYLAAI